LQDHLRSLYAPYLLYAYEVDCEETNFEQEPEPDSRSITDICIKLRVALERLVASQDAKWDRSRSRASNPYRAWCSWGVRVRSYSWVEAEPLPNNAAKSKPEPEPEPTVVDEPEPEAEIGEPLVFNRSLSGTSHGASATNASCEGSSDPEIARLVRFFADLPTGDVIIEGPATRGAHLIRFLSRRLRLYLLPVHCSSCHSL